MPYYVIKNSLNYWANYPAYVYGLWRIMRLQQPIISIFGGKHAAQDSSWYKLSFQLGSCLVKNKMSVLTGGGPGIMESAQCGAALIDKKRALGIGVKGVDVNYAPLCAQDVVVVGDFGLRKALLIMRSAGFVIFPGGVGTLDELLEVVNLIKVKKMKPVPIVLVGTDYWRDFLNWFNKAIESGFIPQNCAQLFTVTNENDVIIDVLCSRAGKD